ncbi:MAG TPA: 30S ribosomal protein S6 [Verrucomicrobiae bacterium]|nr:30S ribosomal protein S6 [Verrucomicrobiae bacterium]
MKRYEGLFILSTAGKEDGVKEALERISAEITAAGGRVETIQKMDRRPFARVANKKHSSGFYANIIFTGAPALVNQLRHKLALNDDVFRVLFTVAPKTQAAK